VGGGGNVARKKSYQRPIQGPQESLFLGGTVGVDLANPKTRKKTIKS